MSERTAIGCYVAASLTRARTRTKPTIATAAHTMSVASSQVLMPSIDSPSEKSPVRNYARPVATNALAPPRKLAHRSAALVTSGSRIATKR